ncbi:hypothetical protein QBC35DRAFT_441416 [Podospora australis]|uniref:HAUS augmin-like complex subunit 1 n=1 Tax=Podospora australis TaxID=1536484 RepID=A0AAN6WQD4_9PEZI|nr:hypothetical protein QBC35DRAFT_441416 [Podospora australis]
MAHFPPTTAIFSPSVARAAASAAKDWSYVDAWLSRNFPSRPVPPFERNADTLRALLALASANEQADEERVLLSRLESEALSQLQQSHTSSIIEDARAAILTSIETSLTREGTAALEALAQLALQLNTPLPTPSFLGTELLGLSVQLAKIEQTLSRIDTLTSYITTESTHLANISAEIDTKPSTTSDDDYDNNDEHNANTSKSSDGYHPSPALAKSNLDVQRRIKTLSARLPELRDKLVSLSSSSTSPYSASSSPAKQPPPLPQQVISIPEIRKEEEVYLALLQEKKDLDAQLSAFAGLPHDTAAARGELEGLRRELRKMTQQRDSVFEGLVERETPKKTGRR